MHHPLSSQNIAEQYRNELETAAAWRRLRRAARATRPSDPTVTSKRRWTIRRPATEPVVTGSLPLPATRASASFG